METRAIYGHRRCGWHTDPHGHRHEESPKWQDDGTQGHFYQKRCPIPNELFMPDHLSKTLEAPIWKELENVNPK